jgi:hypothetical protein
MFGIFHGDVLIGRSELESGRVAFRQLEPTDAFAALRKAMKPGRDGTGKVLRDTRCLAGVCARSADGIARSARASPRLIGCCGLPCELHRVEPISLS